MYPLFANVLCRLKKLNIYSSWKTANNEYELENERISTHITYDP